MDNKDIIDRIKPIAGQMRKLAKESADIHRPVVAHIIKTSSRDIALIESTLDSLLNCAWDPSILELFKDLCRYLYTFDKGRAVEYIYAYRDMWDENEDLGLDTTQVVKALYKKRGQALFYK